MKKTIISIILFSLINLSIFSQTIIHFPGTGDTYADPDGSAPNSTAEVGLTESLLDAYTTYKDYSNPILIGHSQGGMRALGYASYLHTIGIEEAAGVISVGGPIRGYTPLSGGYGVMANRIGGVVTDLSRGANAALNVACPLAGILQPINLWSLNIVKDWAIVRDNIDIASVDDLTTLILTGRMSETIKLGDTFEISEKLINDLTPDSTHIKTYLQPQSEVNVPAHNVTVRDGTSVKWIWTYFYGPFHIKVWYWKRTVVPKYKVIRIPTTYKTLPMVSPNTSLAYIYGTNQNTRDFFYDVDESSGDDLEGTYDEVKTKCDSFGDGLKIAGNLNVGLSVASGALSVACFASLNIPGGIAAAAAATNYGINANNAYKASDILLDLDSAMNKKILNTTSSDGFVTADSTTLPQSQTGGCGWTGSKPNVIPQDMTHARIGYDDAIWGTGGSIGNVQRGGIIIQYISKRYGLDGGSTEEEKRLSNLISNQLSF